MGLYDRFELLELRRDDGIQTFHAREIATARPVQVHVIARGRSEENEALLSRLEHLPDAEWRRIVDRGEWEGLPYVVTDRLAGYAGFREWVTLKSDPAARNSALDEQFRELFENAETAAELFPRPGPQNGRGVLAGPAAFLPAAFSAGAFSPAAFSAETRAVPVMAGPMSQTPVSAAPELKEGQRRGIPAEPAAETTGSQTARRPKTAASTALLGIVFGILAAIALLALIVAAIAFRRR